MTLSTILLKRHEELFYVPSACRTTSSATYCIPI